MTISTRDDRNDANALLRLYLDDHWAAAGGGADLARRIQRNNADTDWAVRLREVAEGMLADVSAKHRLWDALKTAVGDLPTLEPFDLDELLRRADDQIETLTEFHRFASREAFGPVADSASVG